MNTFAAFLCSFLLFWTTPSVVDLPLVTHVTTPRYPELAWQSQVHGKVSLKILVYQDGRFGFTEAVEGPPQLVSAAKENLCTWNFAKNTAAEPIPLTVEYEYRIDKGHTAPQLSTEVTYDLPNHVSIVAPEYSASCLCIKKRSKWKFWGGR
jgi:hypothetical protein